jgi:hypothetical protein
VFDPLQRKKIRSVSEKMKKSLRTADYPPAHCGYGGQARMSPDEEKGRAGNPLPAASDSQKAARTPFDFAQGKLCAPSIWIIELNRLVISRRS